MIFMSKIIFNMHHLYFILPHSGPTSEETALTVVLMMMSYFCVKLPSPITDDLEARVCTNDDVDDGENILIEYMDFYIR